MSFDFAAQQRKGDGYVRLHGKAVGVGWSVWLTSALGLLMGVALLFSPSSASAAETHVFKETFGSVAQPTFGEPEGMAVDQATGDLLVIDAGAGTISRFKSDGTPANFSALGTNVIDGHGLGPETLGGSVSFSPNNNAGASFPPAMTASGRGLLPPYNHRARTFASRGATNFNHRQRSPRLAA